MSSRSSARWTSCSARSTDERAARRTTGRAAGELRVHAGEHGAGAQAHRQVSAGPAGRAPSCRCSIWRSASMAAGCRARRWTMSPTSSACRRSGSTRSRPSTRCSTCGRSGKYCCRSARRRPCWLRGSDDVVAACKHKLGIGVGRDARPTGCSSCSRSSAWAPASTRRCCRSTTISTRTSTARRPRRCSMPCARRAPPQPGSVIGRQASMPVGGKTTLTECPRLRGQEDGDAR